MNEEMLTALGAPLSVRNFGRETDYLRVQMYPLSAVETAKLALMQAAFSAPDADPQEAANALFQLTYDIFAKRVVDMMPYPEYLQWLDDNFISAVALSTFIGLLAGEAEADAGKLIRVTNKPTKK